MAVGKALAKNSLVQIGGRLLGTTFGLVTFYLMLRFFDTDGFGHYTTAMTYVTIFAIIVDFGLTLTTTQMISEDGADEARLLGNLVTLRTLTAVVFMSLCPITAWFIPQSQGIMTIIVIGSVTYFFSAIAQMFQGVFQKRLAIHTVVFAEMVNRTISLVGVVLVGLNGGTVTQAAAAFLIGIIAQLAIMLTATTKHVPFRPQLDLAVWRQIVLRSWPIGISILFNLLYLRGDIFFMWIFNLPATIIGEYGSAYKVVDVITMIPVTLMGLVLPLLSLAWSKKNKAEFTKHLQDGFNILTIIAVPFAFGSVLVGVPLMVAIKPDLTLAGQVLRVLGPSVSILCLGSLYGHAVVAINKQKIMMWSYVFVAAVSLIGYIVYIPIYGIWAAAWTTFVSETLIALLAFIVVTLSSRIMVKLDMFARALAASLIMTAAIVFIPMPHVFLTVLMGMIVYAIALSLLGGPKPMAVIELLRSENTVIGS